MTPYQIHRANKRARFKEYKAMQTEFQVCWWCGGTGRPDWWYGPWFPNELAHIVNKPRIEDRRVVVVACSTCHKIEHGADFRSYGVEIEPMTLEDKMRMKLEFDPKFYDLELMQNCSVRILPEI